MKCSDWKHHFRFLRNNEEKQYENMKSRIKYMYENGSESMISMLLSADSMADLLNKAGFVQNVTEYDRDMLENLVKYVKVSRHRR